MSGSELQLNLERKTYLVSTLLAYLFGTQLLSLFLFIFTADRLHTFLVGAMCAAGTLNANAYGYPVLIFKVANFFLAGLWLILNYVDNRAYDYPLIKTKYRLLVVIAPLILTEAFLQAGFFLRLNPAIITSCCGSLFSAGGGTLFSGLAALPGLPMKIAYYLIVFLALIFGVSFYRTGRHAIIFASLSGGVFLVSILSLISFISLYFYELPTHHCPFCILQREYGYIGYPLYIALLGGGISGVSVGLLRPFRKVKSLAAVVPAVQKRLALISVLLMLAFGLIITSKMIFSGLKLAARY